MHFCKNEIGLARNVKDRLNSKVTIKNLEKIQIELKNIKDISLGLFIFVGIDEYENQIFKIIVPKMKLNKFNYICSNKFMVDDIYDYLKVYDGAIIFANGDSFFIYVHGPNGFEKVKYNKVELGNRHNKGGQSQHRHERNYDIVKDHYISCIAEETLKLSTENNWIFGSLSVINKVIEKNPKLQYGGFVDFNKYTINDSKKWTSYLTDDSKIIAKEDIKLDFILTLLETNPDRLEFDETNNDIIQYYMTTIEKPNIVDHKAIYLNVKHKNYEHLFKFNYIGVKYEGF